MLPSFHFNAAPVQVDQIVEPAIVLYLATACWPVTALDAGTIKYVGGAGSEPCVLPDSELSGQRVPASWSVWTPAHLKERDPNPARQCRPDLSPHSPYRCRMFLKHPRR